jgi:hypothetical protein
MECSNEIFSSPQIDGGFPADRTVYLRHDCSGDLNDWKAPVVNGCHKSRQVAHDAAAQSNDKTLAVHSLAGKIFA